MIQKIKQINLKVPRPVLSCEIVIGTTILGKVPKIVDLTSYAQFVVITDNKINHLHGLKVVKKLKKEDKPIHLFKIPSGEKSKTEAEADKILAQILKIKPPIDRKILILALGGGVIGDITGYVAGKCLRGIDYFQLPTTLLAMVDSSLGGKTGVDFERITNMIGLFHLPCVVIMDIEVLKTLSDRQWRSGLAELIKHSLLEPKLFDFLSKTNSHKLKTNSKNLIKALTLSAHYKMSIVSQDFEEKTGLRKVLNFGHTIGRALETATNLSRFTHGEAVAIGMSAALLISQKQGLLSQKEMRKMLNLMKKFDLPTETTNIDLKKLWQAMKQDKKAVKGIPRFVLLEGIGKPKIDCQVDKKIINQVLKEIIL